MRTSHLLLLALLVTSSWGLVPSAAGNDFVFAGYNIENYAPILVPGRKKPGKTPEGAAAVVRIIREISPDILGVCEMGPPPQFDDCRKRLADAGLGYVDFEYVDGPDPDRHLALASRFPIVARQSMPDVSYPSNGTREKVKRGFLDVTVRINDHFLIRILGVHFKSKRPGPEGQEDVLRRNEAHLLRNHIDEILASDPTVNLLVYGDFNDTKDQPAIQEIAGRRGSPEALSELALADNLGDRWTHYWKVDDVYARIDYLFVNRALSPRVLHPQSYVYRTPDWSDASDHRPLVATFHVPNP